MEKTNFVIELPCDFGTKVWALETYCNDCIEQTDWCHKQCKKPTYRIKERIVQEFEVSKDKIYVCGHSHYDLYGIIGEDVFLTFEEAKVALEKANAIKTQ